MTLSIVSLEFFDAGAMPSKDLIMFQYEKELADAIVVTLDYSC